MRLSLFLLTVFVFTSTAATYAQTMKMNLNLRQSSVKNVLKEIESKSDFTFFYIDSEIDMERIVDIKVKNEEIENILKRLLPECEYVVDNKKIVLRPRVMASVVNPQQEQIQVKGKVVDEFGDELPGVNINVLGTTTGVITDLDGNYTISVPANGSLVFSFVGYSRQTIPVDGRTLVNIVMAEDTQVMEEVVVVGFARQKKANLTGSVSSIKVDDILGDRPVTTTGSLLQGTMPGLQTTVTSGEPGGSYSFNIRGTTSINGGGPLIVVDNVPYASAIELINPEDIESITILKDGGSSAIYGARAAFGVILITTKKAKLNQKFQLNYNNSFSFTSPFELPKKAAPREAVQAQKDMGLTSTYTGQMVDEWLGYFDEKAKNPSLYPEGYVINEQGTRYSLTESDILGDFFGTGFEQKHDISASGGTENLSYRLSFGYVNEDGVMASNRDKFERYTLRSFVNAKFTDWLSGQIDVTYINAENSMPNNTDYSWAVSYASYVEMVDLVINDEYFPAGSPANKAKLGGTNVNARANTRMTGRMIATPIKGLELIAEFTYEDLRRTQTNFSKKMILTNPPKYEEERIGNVSTLSKAFHKTNQATWNVYGSYSKNWDKHHFTGMAGFSQDRTYKEETTAIGKDFISDELPAFKLAQEFNDTSDGYNEFTTRGYFGRINYDYDNRYLLEVSGRYDGSSKFPPNHRWGFFPSASIAWRIMQESFMEPLVDLIPEFKIRLSYSTIGNQNINAYQFMPGMAGAKAVWIVDGNRPTTLNAPNLVSDNFTWETIETYNLGFDISLLKNRLQTTFDLYTRNTKDMLATAIELPAVVGALAPDQNVANLRSKGFELEMKWQDRIGKVNYHLGFNLYNYNSKITKIKNETGLFYAQNEAQTAKRYRPGMKIGEIWGYTFDRFYTVDDFVEGSLNDELKGGTLKQGIPKLRGISPNPGDVLFVDYNDDGEIETGSYTIQDPGDLKIIGNSSLKLQYGITGGASWNNISFSFILQGIGKRDMWLSNELTQPFRYEFGTIYAHQLNYWTPENRNSEFPRLYSIGNRDGNYAGNFNRSDRYLMNGAYLRVKNLTLGYTLPAAFVRNLGFSQFRIYTSLENPFTFNHLPKGLDPTLESKAGGLGYPIMKSYSFGFSFTL